MDIGRSGTGCSFGLRDVPSTGGGEIGQLVLVIRGSLIEALTIGYF